VDPHTEDLHRQIERLTRENAQLRSELAVRRLWNPPPELEHAFQDAHGWECLPVPPSDCGQASTLILIAGTEAGAEAADTEAAGQVWRYLLTAAPVRGGIGPFARASMPARLLGYVGEQDGRAVIVLNKDLPRGQVACAARILRSEAKTRRPRPRLLELSAIPLLALWGLLREGGFRSLLVAAVPAATIVATAELLPGNAPAEVRPAPPAAGPSWHRDQVGGDRPGRSPSAMTRTPRPSGTPTPAERRSTSRGPTSTLSPRAPASPSPSASPTPGATSPPPFQLPPLVPSPISPAPSPSQRTSPPDQGASSP
jgi:hypothetical protein